MIIKKYPEVLEINLMPLKWIQRVMCLHRPVFEMGFGIPDLKH